MRTRLLSFVGAILATTAALHARADEPAPRIAADDTWVQCPRCRPGHWTNDPTRAFLSLTMDAGYLYLKPRFSFGYGEPFTIWGGIDAGPIVTPDYAGGYSGLRLEIAWFGLRAGARAVHAFQHQYLRPQAAYNLVDLSQITGLASDYVSLEAEMEAAIPAGPGSILVLGTASSVQFVPAGHDLYEENLHVIVSPPAVYRARVGYALRLLAEGNAEVGVVGEVIEIPDRKAQAYRAGLVATFKIDDHLDAVGRIVVPITGPDSIGFAGADYSELGIRYRWATGHNHVPEERLPPLQAEAPDLISDGAL